MVTVRLTTDGSETNVVLSQQFDDVEEIRLNEFLFTNYQGGTSGACYLRLRQNGLSNATVNNEANPGLLIPVDVLNPHQIYNNPRPISRGQMVNVSHFGIQLLTPAGAAVTFDEASLVLTFVCRRSADSMAEVRRLKSMVDYLPTITDVRTTHYAAGRN